jgi:hypothetical protein
MSALSLQSSPERFLAINCSCKEMGQETDTAGTQVPEAQGGRSK